MNSEQKRELKLAAIITFVLAGFAYASNQDYAEEMRTATDFCGNAESVGAVESDEYIDRCL